MSKFYSTKKLGPISTSHRNWMAASNTNRDSVKCSYIHGYSRYIKFTFQGQLDEFTWVYDFGNTKFIKQWLEDNWDHKVLISNNDPMLDKILEMESLGIVKVTVLDASKGWSPGIEGSCKWVYDVINPQIVSLTNGRVSIKKIEIWEHDGNSALYESTD